MGQAIDQVMSQYGIAPSYAVGGGVKGYQTGGRSTMASGPKLPGLPPVEADYTGTAESVGIEGAAPVKLLADYAKDKAAFDESVRKYGLERKEYDEYATAYRDRFAQYNPYNKPQYDTTGGNSPGTFYPPRDPDGIYPAVMPPVHLGKGIAYDPTPRTPRVLAPSYGAVSQFSNLTPQQMGDAYLRHRQTGYTDADIRNATARQVGAPSDELMGNIYTSAYPQYAKAITDQYAQQFNRAGFGTGANQIDRPGYNYWMNQLSGGAVTPETLASAIRGGSTPFVPTPTVVTPTDPTYEYEVNYANNARGGLVNSYNLGSNNYSHGGAIRGYAQGGEEESTPALTKIALSFDENPEALINTLDDANTISAPLETIAYVPPTEMGNTDQPTAPQMPTDMSFGQFLANLPANIVAMFSGVNDPPGLDAAANAAAAEAVGQAASDSETGNTSGTADIGGSIWNRGGLVRGYNNGGEVRPSIEDLLKGVVFPGSGSNNAQARDILASPSGPAGEFTDPAFIGTGEFAPQLLSSSGNRDTASAPPLSALANANANVNADATAKPAVAAPVGLSAAQLLSSKPLKQMYLDLIAEEKEDRDVFRKYQKETPPSDRNSPFWFALSRGLLGDTKTRGLGGVLPNVADAMGPLYAQQSKEDREDWKERFTAQGAILKSATDARRAAGANAALEAKDEALERRHEQIMARSGGQKVKEVGLTRSDGSREVIYENGDRIVISADGTVLRGKEAAAAAAAGVALGEKAKQHAGAVEAATEVATKGVVAAQALDVLIENYDEAIGLLRTGGARTGYVEKFLPSFRASTVALDNLRNKFGLSVISSVTFGALSKGELDLALNTGLPENLKPKELKEWLTQRREVSKKLRSYLVEQAEYLNEGGRTTSDWIKYKENQTNKEITINGNTIKRQPGLTDDEWRRYVRYQQKTLLDGGPN